MDTSKIIELLFYTLPALITGAVAFYFFQMYTKNEMQRHRFVLAMKNQKTALPLRLQAYERLALFIERIDPAKILLRIAPISDDKNDYVGLVIAHIEQEYDHNLTQQIYVSDDCWSVVTTAKNATIQMLRKMAAETSVTNADNLREAVLKALFEAGSPSNTALAFIKNEVRQIV